MLIIVSRFRLYGLVTTFCDSVFKPAGISSASAFSYLLACSPILFNWNAHNMEPINILFLCCYWEKQI